jgi:hypothetical protein
MHAVMQPPQIHSAELASSSVRACHVITAYLGAWQAAEPENHEHCVLFAYTVV